MLTWSDLPDRDIDIVRILWPDLHGVARGKDVVVDEIHRVTGDGLGFCQALLLTDLTGLPVSSAITDAGGWSDAVARPDARTLREVPYAPGLAVSLADILDPGTGEAHALSSRAALQRQVDWAQELDLTPIMAPELEFYLCRPDERAEHAWVPYVGKSFGGYLVGHTLDPDDILVGLIRECRAMGLGVFAGNHEFSGGQLEINHAHSEAVDAADRAFLFRHAVKELASRRGLRATFMGKPFNGLAGSGMHAHVSLVDRSGANQFADVGAPDGLSDLARHFVAGLLQHAPASMALLCPNVNAFTRINEEDSLAPGAATWGMDNRTAYVRVPPERGAATRLEVRAADASANPYLVAAAILAAGLDGIERQLEVPAPLRPGDHVARTLPRDPATALRALQEDERLVAALGPALVESFVALKAHEHRRFEQAVTDWEFEEFSWLL